MGAGVYRGTIRQHNIVQMRRPRIRIVLGKALQRINERLIEALYLPVGAWVIRGRHTVLNANGQAHLLHDVVDKLAAIIGHDSL